MLGPLFQLSCQPAVVACISHDDCASDQLCVEQACRKVDGFLDELRISSSARSAAWTLTQYRSITDDLLFFGSEQLR